MLAAGTRHAREQAHRPTIMSVRRLLLLLSLQNLRLMGTRPARQRTPSRNSWSDQADCGEQTRQKDTSPGQPAGQLLCFAKARADKRRLRARAEKKRIGDNAARANGTVARLMCLLIVLLSGAARLSLRQNYILARNLESRSSDLAPKRHPSVSLVGCESRVVFHTRESSGYTRNFLLRYLCPLACSFLLPVA